MPIEPMGAEPTNYSASVVCKRDSLGAMILEMKLNPSRHSIEKVSLAFGMARPKQKAQQIGGGVGHYDAEKQRYYFSVYYQVVTQLANNQILYSDLYPVHGWVSTRTNTLGLQL
ncbi:hypothetical protein [Hymenobacter chitinivorans]|nr:hypothetical protein [Hymenobacter chitinivorans]